MGSSEELRRKVRKFRNFFVLTLTAHMRGATSALILRMEGINGVRGDAKDMSLDTRIWENFLCFEKF